MLRSEIHVNGPADRLLYEGLPLLRPVLEELGEKALLIGGLATAAWLTARPVGLPARATRDVDLGIDHVALGISRNRARIQPLLREHEFEPGYRGEGFRFARETNEGPFVVDLLVAPEHPGKSLRSLSQACRPSRHPGSPTPSAAALCPSNSSSSVPSALSFSFRPCNSMPPMS